MGKYGLILESESRLYTLTVVKLRFQLYTVTFEIVTLGMFFKKATSRSHDFLKKNVQCSVGVETEAKRTVADAVDGTDLGAKHTNKTHKEKQN